MLLRAAFAIVAGGLMAHAQSAAKAPRKTPGAEKPVCAPGAICFSGRVSEGQEFRRALNDDLELVLAPGWNITIVPTHSESGCDEFASVVNPPYRAHRDLYIDMSYGWSAEQEVSTSPREFSFVTNCADYKTEAERLDMVLWPYTTTKEKADEALAKLGTSPLGKGRLWITGSRISHDRDTAEDKGGRIEWMSFSVEIKLPRP
jgi:hypothetical protein